MDTTIHLFEIWDTFPINNNQVKQQLCAANEHQSVYWTYSGLPLGVMYYEPVLLGPPNN